MFDSWNLSRAQQCSLFSKAWTICCTKIAVLIVVKRSLEISMFMAILKNISFTVVSSSCPTLMPLVSPPASCFLWATSWSNYPCWMEPPKFAFSTVRDSNRSQTVIQKKPPFKGVFVRYFSHSDAKVSHGHKRMPQRTRIQRVILVPGRMASQQTPFELSSNQEQANYVALWILSEGRMDLLHPKPPS